ncbi:unnamed protein product [Triticum turgidum subsp. durum]|uniref:S-acyltransferase n=1 Tax=Triticum turgidum subsp. durum TaxID=4567 RepID=A0A9R0S9S8_TRITD|nr:unnamed protein product [Triticum turgidum subsp. durum]
MAKIRERKMKDVNQVKCIKDGAYRFVVKEEEIKYRWREYFGKLFGGGNESSTIELDNSIDDTKRSFVRQIQEYEVREALKRMKGGKAMCPDCIPIEVWRGFGDIAIELLMGIDLSSSTFTGNWSQLCPTCKRNKWDFLVFLCMGIATTLLGAAVGFHRLWTEPIILSSSESWTHFMVTKHPGAVLFMFMDIFLLTGALILMVAQAVMIARNLTTNEAANQSRYTYLRGPDGRFRNPYNQGWQKNCVYFLVNGYNNDEEAAWPTLQQTV